MAATLADIQVMFADAAKLRKEGRLKEANFKAYAAKTVFDKVFPNPTYCPSCGQKVPESPFRVEV